MNKNHLIIKFVVLGKTEPSCYGKDSNISICTAGWSEEIGFVRIIPVRPDIVDKFTRWKIVQVKVYRTNKDNRFETYKLSEPNEIEVIGELPNKDRKKLIESLVTTDCIEPLNNKRRSLAIVEAQYKENYVKKINLNNIDQNDQFEEPGLNSQQLLLTQFMQDYIDYTENKEQNRDKMVKGYIPTVHQRNPNRLKIKYRCGDYCLMRDFHDQTVLDWGLSLLIKKNPKYIDNWADAFRFNNHDWKQYFLLGNLRDHRTSWVIISIFYFRRTKNRLITNFIDVKNSIKEKRQRLIQESCKRAQNNSQKQLPI